MSNKVFVRGHIGRLKERWESVDLSSKEYDFFDSEYVRDIAGNLSAAAEAQENLDRLLEKAKNMIIAEDGNA